MYIILFQHVCVVMWLNDMKFRKCHCLLLSLFFFFCTANASLGVDRHCGCRGAMHPQRYRSAEWCECHKSKRHSLLKLDIFMCATCSFFSFASSSELPARWSRNEFLFWRWLLCSGSCAAYNVQCACVCVCTTSGQCSLLPELCQAGSNSHD